MSADEASRIARAAERIRRNSARVALPTAAILGAGAALAVADVGGSGNTITGCFVTGTIIGSQYPATWGALRVIDPTGTPTTLTNSNAPSNQCASNEKQITWNQSGPQGPTGSAGTNGSAGVAGAPGLVDTAGLQLTNNSGGSFLKIEGIDGEAKDKDHKDWIGIESFSWGASNAGSAASGGAGKSTIQSFSIRRLLDKSSPKLLAAAVSGANLGTLKIDLTENVKGTQKAFLEIKLDNAILASVSNSGNEEIDKFAFLKASETFLGATGGSHLPAVQIQPINLG